eukprot:4704146-Amphidinium_carterae.2
MFRVPAPLANTTIAWLENFSNLLSFAVSVQRTLEPRAVHQIVLDAMKPVVCGDMQLITSWQNTYKEVRCQEHDSM